MRTELTINNPDQEAELATDCPNFVRVIHRVAEVLPDRDNPFLAGRHSEQDLRCDDAGECIGYTERYEFGKDTVYVVVSWDKRTATFVTNDDDFAIVLRHAISDCGLRFDEAN